MVFQRTILEAGCGCGVHSEYCPNGEKLAVTPMATKDTKMRKAGQRDFVFIRGHWLGFVGSGS